MQNDGSRQQETKNSMKYGSVGTDCEDQDSPAYRHADSGMGE